MKYLSVLYMCIYLYYFSRLIVSNIPLDSQRIVYRVCLNKDSIDLSLSVLNHRRTIITPDVKTVSFLSPPTTTPETINPRPHYKRQYYIHSYILLGGIRRNTAFCDLAPVLLAELRQAVWARMCNRANIVSGALDSNAGFDTAIKREPGASSVWDLDWGLPRVKYGIGECNPTLCQREAGLVTSWSERSERSNENPGELQWHFSWVIYYLPFLE